VLEGEIDDVLEQYAPIVKSIAKNAFSSSAAIDYADLCQIGALAVLKAIKKYDPPGRS
jgi:DNA-directed RNA polymerase specialized sigma subunit